MKDSTNLAIESGPDRLTGIIQSNLANPARNADIDLHGALNDVLKDVGLSTADSGGKITFHGRDPIIPALFRFGSLPPIALAANAGGLPPLSPPRTGAGAEIVIAKVRTFEEFRKELQYTEVLSRMSLVNVEKIGESEPIPFMKEGTSPLDGIRALGMGHVIAGAAIGRDLALHGADVLN